MKLTLATGLFVAASAAALAQAPAGSSNTQNSSPQQRQGSTASQQSVAPQNEQTLTGCLTSADNIYTLTVMDDSGAPGTTAETTQYTLAPGTGVDLQPLLNKRVTVKGTDAGPAAQTTNRVEMKSPATPAATGTSGTASGANSGSAAGAGSGSASSTRSSSGTTATVQTTAKARINTKTFNVTNAQPASGSCGA